MVVPPNPFVPVNQIAQVLGAAIEHHRAGNLAEAEKGYRHVLALRPNHPDALHLLGIIAGVCGHVDAAVDLISAATRETPDQPLYFNTLSDFLRQKGRFEDSAQAARSAIALKPNFPEAYNSLGVALMSLKRTQEAIAAYRHAIDISPQFPDAYNNLCVGLKELGRFDKSIAAGQKAVEINPNQPLFQFSLGNALAAAKRFEEAIEAFGRTLKLNPGLSDGHYALGLAFIALQRDQEALGALEEAVRLNPRNAEVWNNVGLLRWRQRQHVEACIDAFKQAIAAKPEYAEAHYNLGLMQLIVGDYENGWDGYEKRWHTTSIGMTARNLPRPEWDGGPLNGRTILLHAEQGSGDTIQFARYIPLVLARGGRVILGCQPGLNRLMAQSFPQIQVVPQVDLSLQYDVHCPLMSLARVFRTRLDSIPGQVPYLGVEPALIEEWSRRFAMPKDRLKVGLAWAGAKTLGADEYRSMTFEQLAPLLKRSDISFYSLQKGPAALAGERVPPGLEIVDIGSTLTDFADTAAVISSLDLVISVDTSVAHLSAALARPTWILIRSIFPEWRWLLSGDASPWYPTARLFRQPIPGDWRMAVENVAEALKRFEPGQPA